MNESERMEKAESRGRKADDVMMKGRRMRVREKVSVRERERERGTENKDEDEGGGKDDDDDKCIITVKVETSLPSYNIC